MLDPHTGELLALVGGRNYGQSQLNHAVARRPTGSIFKPFVYAAAMNTALTGGPTVWTPASLLEDEQTTFLFDNQVYEPKDCHGEYKGEVSAEYALAHSLNNATIKLAEAVGYQNVVQLAKAAGIKSVQATPAMAIWRVRRDASGYGWGVHGFCEQWPTHFTDDDPGDSQLTGRAAAELYGGCVAGA